MSVFKTLFSAAVIVVSVLSVSGCRNTGVALKKIDKDKYYRAAIGGQEYFFRLDSLGGKKSKGHYYAVSEAPVAPRHDFEMGISRKKVTLETCGNRSRIRMSDITVSLYTEPEFSAEDTTLFRIPLRGVKTTRDIEFGTAEGYWTSLQGVEAEVSKVFTEGFIRSFKRRNLKLTLDLYQPDDLTDTRPLIMFIHGGAFYVGDKSEPAFVDFCEHFASLGYVTASINYRLGFHAGKGAIERAAYCALQDANAAMRFLTANAGKYGIDTGEIYVAGSSAGSITALNLAYMKDEDRPESTYGGRKQRARKDLGDIDEAGNEIRGNFRIRAVANMWGAISSMEMIRNGHADIISFHGDADEVVPYGEGYPFAMAGKLISQTLSEKMFGSACIDSAARSAGLRSEMYTFAGEGHALNTSGKDKKPNDFHTFIKDRMKDFFYTEMVPHEAEIIPDGNGRYHLSTNVGSLKWKAEGGFFLKDGKEAIVLWRADEPQRTVLASGKYENGIGYETSLTNQ